MVRQGGLRLVWVHLEIRYGLGWFYLVCWHPGRGVREGAVGACHTTLEGTRGLIWHHLMSGRSLRHPGIIIIIVITPHLHGSPGSTSGGGRDHGGEMASR